MAKTTATLLLATALVAVAGCAPKRPPVLPPNPGEQPMPPPQTGDQVIPGSAAGTTSTGGLYI